jgi:hypothetical protein
MAMRIWSLMRRAGRAERLALVGVIAASAAVLPASGAHAGTSCSAIFGCSQSMNLTSLPATAWHDWTCSSGSTGTASTGCKGGSAYYLAPGAWTPDGQDWDVLQIDAGWCYRVNFVNWYGKDWDVTYNRIGQSTPVYVKIEDGSIAYIIGQSGSSCP